MQDVSRGMGFGGGNQAWSRELFHVEHSAANWELACSTWNGLGAVYPAILGELFHVERGRTISYSTTGYWNWLVTQTSLRLSGS
jgi:hypothetical protein